MCFIWVVSFLVLAVANSQDVSSECPAPNGYFADAVQCDKYYECRENILSEKLCPDGMAFNDFNPNVEKCDLLSAVNCTGRPELQPAQPTANCHRQNGNFEPKEGGCQAAWRCVGGVSNLITCPEGLVFSLETGICDWPDQAGRKNCNVKETLNFTCPSSSIHPQDVSVIQQHPLYADPDDCQYFYVCINGKEPRRNGCRFGLVYNNVTTQCDTPANVAECEFYYAEFFDNYFTELETNPAKYSGDIIAAAIESGYDAPLFVRDKVRIAPGPGGASRKPPTRLSPAAPKPPARISSPSVSPSQADDTPIRRPSTRPGSTRPDTSGTSDTTASSTTSEDRREPGNRRPGNRRPGNRRPGNRPERRRPGGGNRRTRPTTTTTTTTTTTEAPKEYDDYYYEGAYYDYPADETAGPATIVSSNDVPSTAAAADQDVAATNPVVADPVPATPSSTRNAVPFFRQ